VLSNEEIVLELLRTFNEAQATLNAGAGVPGDGASVVQMGPMWRDGSYADLEKVLRGMRSESTVYMGVAVATLYWHIAERYLRSSTRVEVTNRKTRSGGGVDRRVVRVYSAAYCRLPEAKQLAGRGLALRWLVARFEEEGKTPVLPPYIAGAPGKAA
jgi:hypothetical protein